MKICYVANSRFPSERAHMTQIVQMCNAFAEQGHEVTLLATDRTTEVREDPEAFFGVPIRFSVVRIPVPDIAGRAPQIPGFLRPYLFSFQRLVFSYRAARRVREQSYTHLYGRDEWVLWLISLFTDIRIVWESHEARYSFAARRILVKGFPLVVISEGIRNFYTRRGIETERILVAHDAVDERFFGDHVPREKARAMLGIETGKPVVMYVGGLEGWKGAQTLFRASKNQDEFETYVVGGKDSELEQFRTEYPWVHFLGPRPYRDLPCVQRAADVLVIPNTATTPLSAEYTSPLKLFTYMTSRVPIVASRVPSITNVLTEDEAFFCIPDDPRDLAGTVREALKNSDAAKQRRERAYAKSRRYTWKERAQAIQAFLGAAR